MKINEEHVRKEKGGRMDGVISGVKPDKWLNSSRKQEVKKLKNGGGTIGLNTTFLVLIGGAIDRLSWQALRVSKVGIWQHLFIF